MSTRFSRRPKWRRGLVNASTATAFPNSGAGPIPTTTKPVTVDSATSTGNLVVVETHAPAVDIAFFATGGAQDNTATSKIFLWRKMLPVGGDSSDVLHVPHLAAYVEPEVGERTGSSGGVLSATEKFFYSIVVFDFDSDLITAHGVQYESTPYITLRMKGSDMFGVYFNTTGISPSGMNILYACHDYDN